MVEALYARLRGELVKWCTLMTGDKQAAEDLVQEAFVRALDNEALLSNLKDTQQRAWLYRTVRNLYVDRVRHASFETLTDAPPETSEQPEELAAVEWEPLLAALPDDERLLFTLRYLGGWNAAQLAERFGMPPGTVRAKLSRARKRLQIALGGA